MHYVYVFLAGLAVGGAGVGYVAYNYGKKVAAALAAVKKA